MTTDRDEPTVTRDRRLRTRTVVTAMAFGAVWLVTACDPGESDEPAPPADDSLKPDADTYEAAIAEVLDLPDEPPADQPPDPLPVVYIVPIDGSLGIDDQASVIDSFAVSHDVRFVDALAAAVDGDAPGSPPRDDAIVLAVGPIDPNPPHLIRIEQYHTAVDVDATLLTLAFVVDHWVVIAAESVPAEVLTDVG